MLKTFSTYKSELSGAKASYNVARHDWTIQLNALPGFYGHFQIYYFIANLSFPSIEQLPMTAPLIAFNDELITENSPSAVGRQIIINTVPENDPDVATIGDLFHTSRKIIHIIADHIDSSERHYLATEKLYTLEASRDIAQDIWSIAKLTNPQNFDETIDDVVNNFFGTLNDPIMYPTLKKI